MAAVEYYTTLMARDNTAATHPSSFKFGSLRSFEDPYRVVITEYSILLPYIGRILYQLPPELYVLANIEVGRRLLPRASELGSFPPSAF